MMKKLKFSNHYIKRLIERDIPFCLFDDVISDPDRMKRLSNYSNRYEKRLYG